MKIAFLNLYGGAIQRGAETFTESLAEKLREHHEVIWYQGFSRQMPEHGFNKGLIGNLQKRLFLDKANREVLAFTVRNLSSLHRQKFDLIIPMNGFWQLLLLKILKPFAGHKLLVTGHSGPGWDERFNLYLKPDIFIATTQPTAKWAKKNCPWTRVETIPYAIDESIFNKAKPIKLNLPRPIILCPAALVPYKRVDLAIRAVAKLNKGSLVVLGKGFLESKLKNLGKKALGERFHLTNTPHSKVASYYKTCDLVTLPSSTQENSPMVFLEALAANKTVVTTDTPRNRWMLGQAGMFCDPKDVSHYTKELKNALKVKEDNQLLQAIDKALTKFRWESVLSQYLEVLKSLL